MIFFNAKNLKFTKPELLKRVNVRSKIIDSYIPIFKAKRALLLQRKNENILKLKELETQYDNIYTHINITFLRLLSYDPNIKFLLLKYLKPEILTSSENVSGIFLNRYSGLKFFNENINDPFLLPHIKSLLNLLKKVQELFFELKQLKKNIDILEKAYILANQKTNLFEKKIEPLISKQIHQIDIFLSDTQLSDISKVKLCKNKFLNKRLTGEIK